MIKDTIVFSFESRTYSVVRPSTLILLPNGKMLSASWNNNVYPSVPVNLKFEFEIAKASSINLRGVATLLGATLAQEVMESVLIVCPKGCMHPTRPVCDKCGSMVQLKQVVMAVVPDPPRESKSR